MTQIPYIPLKDIPDVLTPSWWLETYKAQVHMLLSAYGGTWDEVLALADGKTYDEFCDAFGQFFLAARSHH